MTEKTKTEKKWMTIFEQFKAAQSQFKPLKKDSVNPFFKSRYASLSSVLDSVIEPLNDNGLSLSQSIENGEIITNLRNDEGETIVSKRPFVIPKVVKEVGKGNFMLVDETDPQMIGKTETYARRYALKLALGITDEDDDAESIVRPGNKPAQQAKPATVAKPATESPAQKTQKTESAKSKTLEEIAKIEGVTVTEDGNTVTVSGKTFALANDLRVLGFKWEGQTKTWTKSKMKTTTQTATAA